MAAALRKVVFDGPAIPWHELGDVAQFIETATTADELYRVDAITLRFSADEGFMQRLEVHHYGAVPA